MKASAYDARMPYPAAWGAVACTELHGHINDSPGQEVIVRLVAHRRLSVFHGCGLPPREKSEMAGGNHSGIE
jgi:hypothetical protein